MTNSGAIEQNGHGTATANGAAAAGPEARPAKIPRHVAVIMDGNGRWAKSRSLMRVAGHQMGVDSVRDVVRASGEFGVEFLTMYAFSVENWKRPQGEIDALMGLLEQYLRDEVQELNENNVRLQAIGRLTDLPESVQDQLQASIEATRHNTGLTLVLALSYSGRVEMAEAVQEIVQKVQLGQLNAAEIDEDLIGQYLYTRAFPDPDLLIRTGGEMRLSNFLLWQVSYTELYVTTTPWPDFRRADYIEALHEFSQRQRRFGGV